MIDADLRQLLAPAATEARTIPLRLVRKRGEPLLLLPRESAPAITALGLYPAQSPQARAAQRLLALALRVRWPLPGVALDFAESAPFVRFLASIEGVDLRTFAVSFGNPRALGRRFLFLLFDRTGAPRAVVKAGVTAPARKLIDVEADLLEALPPGTPGAPPLRGRFSDASAAAFALDFVPGAPPRNEDGIEPVLTAWLDRSRRVPLAELPAWQRIADRSPLSVHPALMHGDFAPWNVRVHGGRWTIVDWERGELAGVPGWDWLHFVVQRAVLVERLDAAQVRQRITALLRSAPFARYAHAAGFAGSEHLIAAGYVRYCAEVLRPTERASVFAELAALTPPQP